MAATFSYAQAAKGVSSPVTMSKPTSGSATPAKDATSKAAPTSVVSVGNWADDAETDSAIEQPTTANETQPQKPSAKPVAPAQSADESDVATPDIDALSSSTAAKDDDVSSQPNMSSESTWDNKSQASTSVDKSVEPVEKTSEKTKKAKSAPVKPLKEAPLPTVNVWQQRADEQKTKAKPAPTQATNGTSATKKSNVDGNKAAGDSRSKGRDDDKAASSRKDTREADKKGAKGRPSEREVKAAPTALPLPPDRDQESWPTPETAVDEDRKKAQEKGEKERKDSAPNGASSKQEWVKVPYTPSVVFNTPLPNAAGSRRGGRPSGRGGAQTGGRSAGFATNGAGQAEKDGSASDATPNGEQTKRVDGTAVGGNTSSPGSKDQVAAVNGEKSKGPAAAPFEPETQQKRASATADMSQMPNQNGTIPRQHPNKPSKGRRGDFSGAGERRRDGAASPTKDGFDGRPTATGQADGQGENERRAFDGPNGHPSKQNRYSYSGGRDRPRGGGRGGRGGFPNGHQFTNGHSQGQQSSSSFSLGPRSPTTFNPENSTFFPAPQGKYGRNGHRSQSVADSYRYPPYQSGPPMAPLQTYNMYDYNMVQPMSAVPYSPYNVDQFALFSMITTQVEYYFSVDNLLKDMYLRRHMDSQGFVSLDFIAAFNRIKQLTTDLELLKLVCQQSSHVQYRTGEDGKDRLRRRESWEQWVLNMAERDESAQNDGPKELHNPPVPNPAGFDQSNPPQYPVMHAGYGNDVTYPQAIEFVPGATAPAETLPNGTSEEAVDGSAVSNGHPIEESTKA